MFTPIVLIFVVGSLVAAYDDRYRPIETYGSNRGCGNCQYPRPNECLCSQSTPDFHQAPQRPYLPCVGTEIPRQTCPIPLPCGYVKSTQRKLIVKRPCPVARPCPMPIPVLPSKLEEVPATPFSVPEAPEIYAEAYGSPYPPEPCKVSNCGYGDHWNDWNQPERCNSCRTH